MANPSKSKKSTSNIEELLISSVRFRGDKMYIEFNDSRIMVVPLKLYPEIEALTSEQKKKHGIMAGYGLGFQDLDKVYHISDFIGYENKQGL